MYIPIGINAGGIKNIHNNAQGTQIKLELQFIT